MQVREADSFVRDLIEEKLSEDVESSSELDKELFAYVCSGRWGLGLPFASS